MKSLYHKFINRAMLVAVLMAATMLGLEASSHREAPLISNDPLADNTDVYAFVSPDNPNTVTFIANYIPAQLPHGGPNYYTFGENIRYEIHVDNNINTTGDDIIYRFTFNKTNEDPTTFFNIRLGKQNQKATYTLEKSTDGGQSFTAIINNGVVPPNNIGPRSIQGGAGLNTTYEQLMSDAIMTASTGEKVFAGPVDDPFFVDLGGIFDLGDAPRQNTMSRDGLSHYNTSALVVQVPIAALQKDGKDVSMAANILDPDFVIGVWASSSRQKIRTLAGDGTESYSDEWVQVSRLGMPLTNEAVIPIGDKDEWNARSPYNENPDHFEYFYNPELALYMDDDLFGGAVPAFAPLRVQRNSLQQFDFGNQQDGLFPLKGNPALDGTALDDAVFGTLLLPGPGKPRSVDLWPAFHTGVPNLAPYQLATGKGGNPLAEGKPFVNNFLPNGGDMLRLNMATPPTPRDDESFSSLGLIQAAVLGLTDPNYNANADLEWIPNMDGFPNGRRLEDDVTRIELQAVGGVVLAAIGLWYDDFDASDPNASPVTQDLLGVLGYTTGVEANDAPFMHKFPYLAAPWSGTGVGTGKEIPFEQPDVLPPTPFADKVESFTLVNAKTDEDIGTHNDGGIINLAIYPYINIRANTNPKEVGSVVFDLNGKKNFRTENVFPYAVGGDAPPGEYFALDLPVGDYELTATPFSKKRGKGEAGTSTTIRFTLVNNPLVSSFTLVNADTDKDVMELTDGAVVDLQKIGTANLNVRANIMPKEVGSVVFDLNEQKGFRTENVFPYALAGDAPPGKYFDWVVAPGMYTITATPFSEKRGKGEAGLSRTISFEVVDDASTVAKENGATERSIEADGVMAGNAFATDEFSIGVYPNPVADRFSFNFSGETNENVTVNIYNLNGKLLGTQNRKVSGVSEVEVGVQDFQLEPGVYLVKVVPEHAQPSVFRIVKK